MWWQEGYTDWWWRAFTYQKEASWEKSTKNLLLINIALSKFYVILSYEIVKHIWDTLSKFYLISMLITKKNELFKFKPDKSIKASFNRFTIVTNESSSLERK